jgi:hypothetical protein
MSVSVEALPVESVREPEPAIRAAEQMACLLRGAAQLQTALTELVPHPILFREWWKRQDTIPRASRLPSVRRSEAKRAASKSKCVTSNVKSLPTLLW